MTNAKVIATAWHRNGVVGVGFQVSIVEDPECGRMLVVDFNPDYKYVPPGERDEDYAEEYGYTAVLNIDKAAQGNIFMYPERDENGELIPDTGGNAWRGDRLGDQYRPLIRQAADEQYERAVARLREGK